MRKFIPLASLTLAAIAGAFTATQAQAQSQSDISGTNIWNNVVPLSGDGSVIDPDLAARIDQLNEDSEVAYEACNAAIAQAEQNRPEVRRYSRRPSQEVVPVPAACRELESLRVEMESLRASLENQANLETTTEFSTW